jgi:hypothetical protein
MSIEETPIQEARRVAEERLRELHASRRIAEAAYDAFQAFLDGRERVLRQFGENFVTAPSVAAPRLWARVRGQWRFADLT